MGGYIYGRGNTIHFGGNVTLQEGKTLQFISDTIIDGGGNIFDLDSFSQLLVDHNVTLTLKNMEFRNKHNTVNVPSIRLTSPGSKLALQNVNFALADEFSFREGQLFIHSDVMVTGTSLFSYRSAAHSYIDRNSNLLFDRGTIYFHYPKTTFNDQWYMNDASSLMAFDNASLFTTHTGIKLTRGTLCLDNGVTVSTFAAVQTIPNDLILHELVVNDGNFAGGFDSNSIGTVSNNGSYFAIAGRFNSSRLQIYSVNKTSLTSITGVSHPSMNSIYDIAWSQDDRYVIVSGILNAGSKGKLVVHQFDGISLIPATSIVTNNTGYFGSAKWSRDNSYVILTGSTVGGLGYYATYRFDGSSLTLFSSVIDSDFTSTRSVAISSDNKYVAIGGFDSGSSSGRIKVFNNNGGILTLIGTFTTIGFNGPSLMWGPLNKYLFALATSRIFAYSFDGVTQLTLVNNIIIPFGQNFGSRSFDISPDGLYLVSATNFGSTDGAVTFYSFNGSTFNVIFNLLNASIGLKSVQFSPDGKRLLIVGNDNAVQLGRAFYEINYRHDTVTQGIRNGIVFGDASLGPDYDLDIEVLGRARVEIDGKMLYDNVS